MRRNNKGFTLLELMIGITLMLVVMLLLHSMFINAQMMYVKAAQRVDVYSQARAALDMIENDLLRMREHPLPLGMRSLSRPAEELSRPEAIRQSSMYTTMSDWERPEDAQTAKIREFLSFVGTNSWWDETEQRYVSGDAMIVYYLRRRLPAGGVPREGAYLVRRMIQLRTMAELTQADRSKLKPLKITENEIASFIYTARVFTDDQGAFQYAARNRSFDRDIMPECLPSNGLLWVGDDQGLNQNVNNSQQTGQVQLYLTMPNDEDRVEFGGAWHGQRTNLSQPGERNFLTARWNYPSVVMIDLTVIDRNMERFDAHGGTGTYRSFARAVQLPTSKPMYRLDERDDVLLSSTR